MVFSSIINLSNVDKKNLAEVVNEEAKKVIPLPLEEMILDWKIIPDQNDKIQNHLVFYFAKEIKDYDTADRMIEVLSKTKDIEDIYLTYANFQTYNNYLLEVKKSPEIALRLLNNMLENTKDYKLEFAYYYAKIAIEYKIEINEGRKFLQFCRKNFKENRIFKKVDLDKIGTKKPVNN